MKISALNYIGNVQNSKNNLKANKEKQQLQQQTQIMMPKHTISEAIGRSQIVSFSGTNQIRETKFIHNCSDSSGKEQIIYDKTTGVFSHITKNYAGKLVRREDFDPINQTQHLVSVEKDGTKIEKIITLNEEKTIVTNATGQVTDFIQKNLVTGDYYEEITEYDIGRKIINNNQSGITSTQVIDLKTNQYVDQGPLVIRERMDEESNTCITENIITKQVLKEEEFDRRGRVIRETEYAEGTNLKIREGVLTQNGDWKEKIYSGVGINALQKLSVTSKNGKEVRVSEFSADGSTEIKRYEISYNRDGSVSYEVNYVPNIRKDVIQEEIDYKDKYGNEYTVFKYTTNSIHNSIASAEIHRKGRMIEEHIYNPDGKTIKQIIEYRDDGSIVKTDLFGTKGRKSYVNVYKANGFLSKTEQYNPHVSGDKLIKEFFYHEDGLKVEVSYDDRGKKQHVVFKDVNGNRLEETEFHPDGKTAKLFIKYNSDGSYSETTYDEFGKEITTNHFDKYGNQIPKNRRKSTNTNESGYQRTNTEDQGRHRRAERYSEAKNAEQKAQETEDSFIKRLTDICAKKDFSRITDSDWARFASILGTDSEIIKNLDHDHFKKLAIKFHPDVNQSEQSHNIACILNALNERNKH